MHFKNLLILVDTNCEQKMYIAQRKTRSMSIGSNNAENLDSNSSSGLLHPDATNSYSSGGLAQTHFQVIL